jgi:hypothetical protein
MTANAPKPQAAMKPCSAGSRVSGLEGLVRGSPGREPLTSPAGLPVPPLRGGAHAGGFCSDPSWVLQAPEQGVACAAEASTGLSGGRW